MKEALENFVGKDQVDGVTCSKTNQEVMAWQQMTLEKLPVVLVLHLKWFDYKLDGCTKILKTVEFPIELKVDTSEYLTMPYIQASLLTRMSFLLRRNNFVKEIQPEAETIQTVCGRLS